MPLSGGAQLFRISSGGQFQQVVIGQAEPMDPFLDPADFRLGAHQPGLGLLELGTAEIDRLLRDRLQGN